MDRSKGRLISSYMFLLWRNPFPAGIHHNMQREDVRRTPMEKDTRWSNDKAYRDARAQAHSSTNNLATNTRQLQWRSAIPDAAEGLSVLAGEGRHIAAAPIVLHGLHRVAHLSAAGNKVIGWHRATKLLFRCEHGLASLPEIQRVAFKYQKSS